MDFNYVFSKNYAELINIKTMKSGKIRKPKKKFKFISGWGKTKPVGVEIISPKTVKEIKDIIITSQPKSIITRGRGRSYGDAAQINKGKVIKLNYFKEIIPNYEQQEITAQAGASIEEILKIIIPKGFFLPVTPGTKKITLGGAIAADVHGKNHYQDGSFGNYIKRIRLINGIGKIITLTPNEENSLSTAELFWATIGGMGLTGIILDATFAIIPIESSLVKVETRRYQNLENLIQDMITAANHYKYTVAWIDSMHDDFRGILSSGNHATKEDLKKYNCKNILSFKPKTLISIPDIIPINCIKKIIIKIFNEIWYRKSPKKRKIELMSIDKFFYPLDKIDKWNNIYGKNGFIQYQIVVPEKNISIIIKVLKKLKKINALSFLPVLKRFSKANKSYLSFPFSGWTLSVDLPANNKKIEMLLDSIDNEIAEIGGKHYLAKDSREKAFIFKKTYTLLSKWRRKQSILDPKQIFMSDLASRLELFD